MPDHYDTLGIDKAATKDQIKKAYRKKAKQLHPDKEMDEDKKKLLNDKMITLNKAYNVLEDEERRANYDRTGEDRITAREIQIRTNLLNFFNMAISQNAMDVVGAVKRTIDKQVEEIEHHKTIAGNEIKRLLGKRDKVLVLKDGQDNLYQMVIDQQVESLKGKIEQMDEALGLLKDTYDELKGYRNKDTVLNDSSVTLKNYKILTGRGW